MFIDLSKERRLLKDNEHKSVIRRRKMREKNLRLASILDAAKKVFSAKGYSGATMDEIALEVAATIRDMHVDLAETAIANTKRANIEGKGLCGHIDILQ